MLSPVWVSTTSARTESVPKSTPIVYFVVIFQTKTIMCKHDTILAKYFHFLINICRLNRNKVMEGIELLLILFFVKLIKGGFFGQRIFVFFAGVY